METQDDPTIVAMDVTPAMAVQWLASVMPNRHLSQSKIDEYTADMNHGNWQLNGETLKITSDRQVADGQHRLHAVVKCGRTVRMFVAFGVEASVADTVDTGRRRTLGDTLKRHGEAQCSTLASTITLLYLFELGFADRAPGGSSVLNPSHRVALALLSRAPGLRDSVRAGEAVRKAIGMRASVAAITHYQFTSIDDVDAEVFFDRLRSGVGLSERDPIRVLRESVIRDRHYRSTGRAMSQQYQWALTVKAWNAFRDGREISLLKWKRGGANPELFPVAA